MAMIELNSNYKDRFTQRRLMRPSYLPDFMKKISFGNFYPFSDRDKMEQEWEMYLMAAPICFIGVPVSYLFVDFVLSRSPRMTPELHRSLMIGYSLFFQRFRTRTQIFIWTLFPMKSVVIKNISSNF